MSFIFFAFIFIVAMSVGYALGRDQGIKEGKKIAGKENHRAAQVDVMVEFFRKDALSKYGGGKTMDGLDDIVKDAQKKLAKMIEIPEKKDDKK